MSCSDAVFYTVRAGDLLTLFNKYDLGMIFVSFIIENRGLAYSAHTLKIQTGEYKAQTLPKSPI